MLKEEKSIPAFAFRMAYDIIAEETPNRAALNRVLELAGLDRYQDAPPPLDNTPAISRAEYERIFGVVWQVFDDVQARSIFRRSGQRAFEHLTRSSVLSYAQFLRAFESTFPKERVALVLRRMTQELTQVLGNLHEFHRDGDDFILDIHNCPYCAGVSEYYSLPPDARVCHTAVAFYEAAVNWASGGKHTVREISCHATSGQDFCRFKIFWNIGVTGILE